LADLPKSDCPLGAEPLTQGLVQVLTGDGKGKTTSALGTVLRAAGRGLRIYIIYFMNTNYDSGEHEVLYKLPNVHWAAFGPGLIRNPEQAPPELKKKAAAALSVAREAMLSGQYDLIMLDEINIITSWGWLELEDVLKLIKSKPPQTELILTGRNAHPEILELADLVTEMTKVKHPYDNGIMARKGIEY
jgi:cob(I)alamin adenosyltransferase